MTLEEAASNTSDVLESPGTTLSHPTPHSERREPAAISVRLEVIDGVDRGVEREFSQQLIRIGTKDDSDLRLRDPTVSRLHLELHGTTAGLLAVDLGSRNGTRVNGVEISESLLPDECRIDLGATKIRVHIGDERVHGVRDLETFGEYVTANPRLKKSIALLRRAATSATTVLIEGETGTGKSVLARRRSTPAARDAAAVRDRRLQRDPADADRERAVRSREGSVHRRAATRVGAFESGVGRHAVPRRDRRAAARLQPKLLRVLEKRERSSGSAARAVASTSA